MSEIPRPGQSTNQGKSEAKVEPSSNGELPAAAKQVKRLQEVIAEVFTTETVGALKKTTDGKLDQAQITGLLELVESKLGIPRGKLKDTTLWFGGIAKNLIKKKIPDIVLDNSKAGVHNNRIFYFGRDVIGKATDSAVDLFKKELE